MKTSRILAAAAVLFAFTAVPAFAETCCEKAKAAGKECAHKCCVEATKKGEVCKKCNPDK